MQPFVFFIVGERGECMVGHLINKSCPTLHVIQDHSRLRACASGVQGEGVARFTEKKNIKISINEDFGSSRLSRVNPGRDCSAGPTPRSPLLVTLFKFFFFKSNKKN